MRPRGLDVMGSKLWTLIILISPNHCASESGDYGYIIDIRGVAIPDDMIEQICILFNPADFISFIQTCRYLYGFSTSDYIWHQIAGDMRLDINPPRHWKYLPGSELKALTIKALKLDHNWRSDPSRITHITKVVDLNSEKQLSVIPLGGEWVVAWNAIRTSQVSVWRLPGITQATPVKDSDSWQPQEIAPVQTLNLSDSVLSNTFRVDAVRQEDLDDIVLVSIMGIGVPSRVKGWVLNTVLIHKVDLKGRYDVVPLATVKPFVVKTWTIVRNRLKNAFYYMQIFKTLVVIACSRGPESTSDLDTHLIVFDTATEATYTIHSPAFSMFDPSGMKFKLYSDDTFTYIVLFGPHKSQINVLVRILPAKIGSPTPSPNYEEQFEDFSASVIDYCLTFESIMEVHTSQEPPTSSTPIHSFTLLASAQTFTEVSVKETASVYHFPIITTDRDKRVDNLNPSLCISMPLEVTMGWICLGKTGYRAVWSSRDWTTDEQFLTKAQLSTLSLTGSTSSFNFSTAVSHLQRAFPFQPALCRRLSLEEASGRVFACLLNGEIYVLHFQI